MKSSVYKKSNRCLIQSSRNQSPHPHFSRRISNIFKTTTTTEPLDARQRHGSRLITLVRPRTSFRIWVWIPALPLNEEAPHKFTFLACFSLTCRDTETQWPRQQAPVGLVPLPDPSATISNQNFYKLKSSRPRHMVKAVE